MEETLAKLCMKALKNPCNGTFAKTLGNTYPIATFYNIHIK